MDEKVNKPSIRFAGFTDAWEQRKFNEIIDLRSGSDHKHLSKGNIPVYGTGGYMFSVNKALSYEEDAIGIGRKGTIDKPYILKAPFWTVDTLFYAVPKPKIDLDFSLCTFLKIDWKKKDESTGVPSLSKQTINSVDFLIPFFNEQIQIGSFFRAIDNVLTLHQRKYDKLLNIKKSMLEKMFPQHGTDVPEIRFAGFTDAWERRKVGNVTEQIIQYATFQSGFPLLTSSRSGLMFQNEYRDNTSTNNQDTLFSVVPMGACTYRHMSDDDIFHFNINELVENGLVSREYPVFVSSIGNNLSTVILYLNSSPKFKAFCREQKMGGTRTRLYYKNLCTFELLLPAQREQIKIAYFFKSLDTLLTLHQHKLTKLQNIKKSCLEKMFV